MNQLTVRQTTEARAIHERALGNKNYALAERLEDLGHYDRAARALDRAIGCFDRAALHEAAIKAGVR